MLRRQGCMPCHWLQAIDGLTPEVLIHASLMRTHHSWAVGALKPLARHPGHPALAAAELMGCSTCCKKKPVFKRLVIIYVSLAVVASCRVDERQERLRNKSGLLAWSMAAHAIMPAQSALMASTYSAQGRVSDANGASAAGCVIRDRSGSAGPSRRLTRASRQPDCLRHWPRAPWSQARRCLQPNTQQHHQPASLTGPPLLAPWWLPCTHVP